MIIIRFCHSPVDFLLTPAKIACKSVLPPGFEPQDLRANHYTAAASTTQHIALQRAAMCLLAA